MLKLHELVHTGVLTSGNSIIKRALLQLSNMCPINPLRLSYNYVSGEEHTSIKVKLKHSAKLVIIWATLWLTTRINPPLFSSSLSHTLSFVVNLDNIVGYFSVMYLKHIKVNTMSRLSSLRWVLNWRCILLLLLNLLLII